MGTTYEQVLPTTSADGARCAATVVTDGAPVRVLVWLPAMGMPARHYLPFAHALAAQGTAVVLHEWRGIGASDRRAGRQHDWGYRALLSADIPATLAVAAVALPPLPMYIGGHSLGGQLSTLVAAMAPDRYRGLVAVASGAPYWRCFPYAALLYLAYAAAPLAAWLVGYLPGRRLGFAGNEARGVIRDWARSGRSGRYTVRGMPDDFEAMLGRTAVPALGIRLTEDWMVPARSLDWLLRHVPGRLRTRTDLGRAAMDGMPATHFGWLRHPSPVAAAIDRWWSA
jgi:predicted alpha/beta hydrolase